MPTTVATIARTKATVPSGSRRENLPMLARTIAAPPKRIGTNSSAIANSGNEMIDSRLERLAGVGGSAPGWSAVG